MCEKDELNICINHIENVSNEVISLYDYIEKMIFPHVDLDVLRGVTPLWMADAGRSAESCMTKENFEKFVRSLEDTSDKNEVKILYWYDVEALLNALQDRFSSTIWMLKEFYSVLPYVPKQEEMQVFKATICSNRDSMNCYTAANTIFINLASAFDILAKLSYELEYFSEYDFSCYSKLKSKDILYNKNLQISPILKQQGMLFAEPEPAIVRKIETLRSEYVHNGPWDRTPKIYYPLDNNEMPLPAFMLMPDMNENGTFITVKNRNKFYSQEKKLNIELISILNDTMEIINNTIVGLKIVVDNQTDKSNSQDETNSTVQAIIDHLTNLNNYIKK